MMFNIHGRSLIEKEIIMHMQVFKRLSYGIISIKPVLFLVSCLCTKGGKVLDLFG